MFNAEKGAKVFAIDTWSGSIEHSQEHTKDLYSRFVCNSKEFLLSGRVYPIRSDSRSALIKLNELVTAGEVEKFDAIYIDASHMARDVLSDAVLSWDLLKVGGRLIFDDYEWKIYQDSYATPKVAIDGFLASYDKMYEVIVKDYQVHLKKISDAQPEPIKSK